MPITRIQHPITHPDNFNAIANHPAFSNPLVIETGSALALTQERHAGRTVYAQRAAGQAITLPAAVGTGDVYRIVIGTTITSNTTTITKKSGTSDVMQGVIETATTTGATTNGFCEALGGSDVTITMNGGTTGGLIGSWLEFQDVAFNKWQVKGGLVGSGSLATSIS